MEERTKPKKEYIIMQFAVLMAGRSDCKRAQIGAAVCSEDLTQIYSYGYNGGAKGQKCICSGEAGNCGCLHAEINALIKCSVKDPNKVMVTTVFPCAVCAKAIVNSGFSKVFYLKEYREMETSKEILRIAGIEVEQL